MGNENNMSRITFTATTPAGTIVKRTSESKTYSHAIITDDKGEWGALSWSSTEALAQKAAVTFRNRGFKNVQVVPVIVASKHIDIAPEVAEIKAAATEAIAEAKADAKVAKAAKAPKAAKVEKAEPTAAELKTAAIREEVITTMAATLKQIRDTREELALAERRQVIDGRALGLSWATLGEMAGLSGVGMRNRYIDLVDGK